MIPRSEVICPRCKRGGELIEASMSRPGKHVAAYIIHITSAGRSVCNLDRLQLDRIKGEEDVANRLRTLRRTDQR